MLILFLAIPIGYLIAWLTKEELIIGRFWFKILIIASIIIGSLFYYLEKNYISWTSTFILIVSVIGLMKSYDKRWTKSKI